MVLLSISPDFELKTTCCVFQALTVLDYMVAHGSERVIDEIREHAYQISVVSIRPFLIFSGKFQFNW